MSWNVTREEWLASMRGKDFPADEEGSDDPVDRLDQSIVERLRHGQGGSSASGVVSGAMPRLDSGVVALGTAAPVADADEVENDADTWRPTERPRALTPPADIGSQVARGAFRPPRRSGRSDATRSPRARREPVRFASPFESVADAAEAAAPTIPRQPMPPQVLDGPPRVQTESDAASPSTSAASNVDRLDAVLAQANRDVSGESVQADIDVEDVWEDANVSGTTETATSTDTRVEPPSDLEADAEAATDPDADAPDLAGVAARTPTLELEAVVEPGPPPLSSRPVRSTEAEQRGVPNGAGAPSTDPSIDAEPGLIRRAPIADVDDGSADTPPEVADDESEVEPELIARLEPPDLRGSSASSRVEAVSASASAPGVLGTDTSNGAREELPVDGAESPIMDDVGTTERSDPLLGDEVLEFEPAELHHDDVELEEVVEPSRPPPTPPPPTPKPTKRRRAWYEDVFAEHFAALAPGHAALSAQRDVDFILACCPLTAGSSVLDVGCGVGHHCLGFAQRGFAATGVDNSMAQLLAASRNNEAAGSPATFQHADMRELELERQYDLVTCLGSTFGYFEEDQNLVCLERMRDRLADGGRLVIQVFNRDYIVGQVPCRSWWQGHGCLVLDETELNFVANRLRVHRTIVFEDARQFEHYMFIRAYTLHELGRMLSSVDMRVLEVSGSRDARGRFYGAASPDIWIVAERQSSRS